MDRLTAAWGTAQGVEDQAGEGVAALGRHFPAGLAVEVTHLDAPERLKAARGHLPDGQQLVAIELVTNLAHQLFEDVFLGDDAERDPELVLDDGEMHERVLHVGEQLEDQLALRHLQHGAQDAPQVRFAVPFQLDQVLEMGDAEHAIDRSLVDRDARVALFEHALQQLAGRRVDRERDHLGAWHHDVADRHVGRPRGRGDDADRPVFTIARRRLGGAACEAHQLLGRAHLRPDVGPGQALDDGVEDAVVEDVQRAQDLMEEVEGQGDRVGDALGAAGGEGLGDDLAEQQRDDGHHHGGDDDAPLVAQIAHRQRRGDRRAEDVDDVVAEQDGHQQALHRLQQLARRQDAGSARGLGILIELGSMHTQEGGLAARKERRAHQADEQDQQVGDGLHALRGGWRSGSPSSATAGRNYLAGRKGATETTRAPGSARRIGLIASRPRAASAPSGCPAGAARLPSS